MYVHVFYSPNFCRMRGVGTAATNMCLVAAGCVEAYYEIGIHCWDIAAAAVIVSEAGGVLMDVEGWLSSFRWNYLQVCSCASILNNHAFTG